MTPKDSLVLLCLLYDRLDSRDSASSAKIASTEQSDKPLNVGVVELSTTGACELPLMKPPNALTNCDPAAGTASGVTEPIHPAARLERTNRVSDGKPLSLKVADEVVVEHDVLSPNETKISDSGRGGASPGVKVL